MLVASCSFCCCKLAHSSFIGNISVPTEVFCGALYLFSYAIGREYHNIIDLYKASHSFQQYCTCVAKTTVGPSFMSQQGNDNMLH